MTYQYYLVITIALATAAHAHSWIDTLVVATHSGDVYGRPGYIRNYTGHLDDYAMNKILDITLGTPVCRGAQLTQVQGLGFPRLAAQAGSRVRASYTENGHISKPRTGDPIGDSGMTFWYGTKDPAQCDTLYGVMEWGAHEGQRGELLVVAPFDDGICTEANETPISKGRGGSNIPCHSAFTILWDVQPGSIYTVYWIWDYSDARHIEIYTSCADIDIIGEGPEGVL
ncbi:hypothetical protein C7212DRAFT_366834 [Tuber magnatum]|uniref:DUF7492 domain-containing protein n=1 Tax=Tuber magnatum TaxID=42249 RepID=A0A317SC21_9PEZI|nr:hypothetical protein C7212DRAFT_366834 [Tuber magnatum]